MLQGFIFSEEVIEKKIESVEVDVPIQRWNDDDQCQLHHEVKQWIDCQLDEVEGLCHKTEQLSMQSGVKNMVMRERSQP